MSWSRRPVDPVSAEIGDRELLVHIGEIHHEFLERPRGEFTSLQDFYRRVLPSPEEMEILIPLRIKLIQF